MGLRASACSGVIYSQVYHLKCLCSSKQGCVKVPYCTTLCGTVTSTKFHYLFNCTIFTYPEDRLKLFCIKYYDIGIEL